MPMKANYASIAPLEDCKKLVTTTSGEKLVFDAQNQFERTFQVKMDDKQTQQVTVDSLDDGYEDSSDAVVGAVIALLVLGIMGVLAFLQWKFVLCRQCLCLKFGKTPGKGRRTGETAGKTPEDSEQMDANDLIKNRKKQNMDLPEGLSDDDSESDSQMDYSAKNMLHHEIASGHEINPEDGGSIAGSAFKGQFPTVHAPGVDQEQMLKMFEMFQQMQAASGGSGLGTTVGQPVGSGADSYNPSLNQSQRQNKKQSRIQPHDYNTRRTEESDADHKAPQNDMGRKTGKRKASALEDFEQLQKSFDGDNEDALTDGNRSINSGINRNHKKNIGSVGSKQGAPLTTFMDRNMSLPTQKLDIKAPDTRRSQPYDPFHDLDAQEQPKEQLSVRASRENPLRKLTQLENRFRGEGADDVQSKVLSAEIVGSGRDPQDSLRESSAVVEVVQHKPKKKKKKKAKKLAAGGSQPHEDWKLAEEQNNIENQLATIAMDKQNDTNLKTLDQGADDLGFPPIDAPKESKAIFDNDEFAFNGLQIDDVSSLDDF